VRHQADKALVCAFLKANPRLKYNSMDLNREMPSIGDIKFPRILLELADDGLIFRENRLSVWYYSAWNTTTTTNDLPAPEFVPLSPSSEILGYFKDRPELIRTGDDLAGELPGLTVHTIYTRLRTLADQGEIARKMIDGVYHYCYDSKVLDLVLREKT
jgi:hypothetical protein